MKRECDYCGIDRGGWHGCYYQLLWLIESYIDKHLVINPNELAAQIADAGYASSKEDTDANL